MRSNSDPAPAGPAAVRFTKLSLLTTLTAGMLFLPSLPADRYSVPGPNDVAVEEAATASFPAAAIFRKAREAESAGKWAEAARAYLDLLSRATPAHVLRATDPSAHGPTRRYFGVADRAALGLRRCLCRDPKGVAPLISASAILPASGAPGSSRRERSEMLLQAPAGPARETCLFREAIEAQAHGDAALASMAWIALIESGLPPAARRFPIPLALARLALVPPSMHCPDPAGAVRIGEAGVAAASRLFPGVAGGSIELFRRAMFHTPLPGGGTAHAIAAAGPRRNGGRSIGTAFGGDARHRAEGPRWRAAEAPFGTWTIPGAVEWSAVPVSPAEAIRFLGLPQILKDIRTFAVAAAIDVPEHPFVRDGRFWIATGQTAHSVPLDSAAGATWEISSGFGGAYPDLPLMSFAGAWVEGSAGRDSLWVVPQVIGLLPVVIGRPMPGIPGGRAEGAGVSRVGLVALDPAAEGRIRWSTEFVADPFSRAFYDVATFSGAPVAVGRTILVGAIVPRNDIEMFLCAIDADSGDLIWQTPAGSRPYGATGTRLDYQATVPASGSAPVVAGDTVVYATNLGLIVACDFFTGAVRWEVVAGRGRSSRGPGSEAGAETWGDNPPVVIGRNVFVAPQDSDLAFVFDLEDGRLVEAVPGIAERVPASTGGVPPARYRYLVAGGSGRVALSGEALRIVDGGGELPLTDGGARGNIGRLADPAIGRGTWCGSIYYFPTASGLMAYDTADPAAGVVRVRKWERVGADAPCEIVAGNAAALVVWRSAIWIFPSAGHR